uniref:COG1361 S-layer family protein n=1 Tax=Acetatifactor sp. TaxID=1872090 RepID=UPI0040579924
RIVVMRRIYSLFLAFIIIFSMPLTSFAAGTVSGNDAAMDSEQTPQPSAVVEQLRIDSKTLYDGMDKTYEQGYIPKVENGKVSIVLPLLGKTYDEKVSITADLGTTQNSPFVFGNYSQTADAKDGAYIFRLEIPLATGRINGFYPVTLTADYLDITGNQAQQNFILYVTITDGINADIGPTKEAVETPKLYISACEITPETVGGEEEFSVTVMIENIGAIRARSVILTYGSDTAGIVPAQTNNTMHLENIASGKSETASFAFQTTKDVLAGDQSFFVKLDYVDLYGGIYTESRTFFVRVIQPSKMEYDPINIPKQVTAGETISVPVSVFNTGKSTLRNVVATISGAGLIPTSSVFFGDILPGESGNGEMEFYVGTLSMTNTTNDYGKSNGTYTITYMDDNAEEHKEEMNFSTEIIQPVEDLEDAKEEQTAGQWWISILVAFAIIAIVVSVIVVTKFSRMIKMK